MIYFIDDVAIVLVESGDYILYKGENLYLYLDSYGDGFAFYLKEGKIGNVTIKSAYYKDLADPHTNASEAEIVAKVFTTSYGSKILVDGGHVAKISSDNPKTSFEGFAFAYYVVTRSMI